MFMNKCIPGRPDGYFWTDWRCPGMYAFFNLTPLGRGFRDLLPLLYARFDIAYTPESLAVDMVKWEAEVEDKLLKFNVKQGWQPLAEFLELPEVPEGNFPHANDGAMFQTIVMLCTAVGYLGIVVVLASPFMVVKIVQRCCCRAGDSGKSAKSQKKTKDE